MFLRGQYAGGWMHPFMELAYNMAASNFGYTSCHKSRMYAFDVIANLRLGSKNIRVRDMKV